MFRTKSIKGGQHILNYFERIGKEYCPFVIPSSDANLTYYSEYDTTEMDLPNVQKFIFCSGLIHTLIFRDIRQKTKTHRNKLLLCENVIFKFDDSIDGKEAFSYPHWYLKLMFTPKSILFGKFWKGEELYNKVGNLIPIPPLNFLSIRSAVKPIDLRFFEITPDLKEIHLSSKEDQESVFGSFVESKNRGIIKSLETIDSYINDQGRVLDLINLTLNSTLYYEIGEWAKQFKY